MLQGMVIRMVIRMVIPFVRLRGRYGTCRTCGICCVQIVVFKILRAMQECEWQGQEASRVLLWAENLKLEACESHITGVFAQPLGFWTLVDLRLERQDDS